jgi:hypothetical protein
VGLVMSYNLSELDVDQKNQIELDKQAAFLVWKLKQATIGPDAINQYLQTLRTDAEKTFFERSIAKYKQQMGVA